MKFLHKIISNFPIVIWVNWLFCFLFFTNLSFYKNNYELFDKIDTIIVYFSMMHFCIFINYYSRIKRMFILSIFMIIILNFIYLDKQSTNIYYFLYITFILTPLTSCYEYSRNRR